MTEAVDAKTLKEELGCLNNCQNLAEGQFLTTIIMFILLRLPTHVLVFYDVQPPKQPTLID